MSIAKGADPVSTNDDAVTRRCSHMLPRKNRQCRMLTKPDRLFCGEHAHLEKGLDRARIQCPLDPKHTIFADDIEKHLKKCNSRVKTDAPWCRQNANLVMPKETRPNFTLAEKCPKELDSLVDKMKSTYAKIPHAEPSPSTPGPFKYLNDQLQDAQLSSETKKHIHQAAVLLDVMDRDGLLADNTCFIEFGAGKARLSYYLSQATTGLSNVSYVLIERSGSRGKFENKALCEDATLNFVRIRSGIEHVDLSKIPEVTKSKRVIALWKHLCGGATDIAIRCIDNGMRSCAEISLDAILAVPCCHHQCDWDNYVAQDFLLKAQFSVHDFDLISKICSWATCGIGLRAHGDAPDHKILKLDTDSNKGSDRTEVGCMAKYLLNYGRARYLESRLGGCKLMEFVSPSVTPENLLLYYKK